jgi:hypothetical protein
VLGGGGWGGGGGAAPGGPGELVQFKAACCCYMMSCDNQCNVHPTRSLVMDQLRSQDDLQWGSEALQACLGPMVHVIGATPGGLSDPGTTPAPCSALPGRAGGGAGWPLVVGNCNYRKSHCNCRP